MIRSRKHGINAFQIFCVVSGLAELRDDFRVKSALGDLDPGMQGLRGIAGQDGHISLRDDFAAIDSGIDVVH